MIIRIFYLLISIAVFGSMPLLFGKLMDDYEEYRAARSQLERLRQQFQLESEGAQKIRRYLAQTAEVTSFVEKGKVERIESHCWIEYGLKIAQKQVSEEAFLAILTDIRHGKGYYFIPRKMVLEAPLVKAAVGVAMEGQRRGEPLKPGVLLTIEGSYTVLDRCGRTPRSYVVLLENIDGSSGAIVVGNDKGDVRVDQAGFGIGMESSAVAPAEPFAIAKEDLERDFGRVLAATPPPPVTYRIYFEGGTAFTEASQQQLKEITSTINSRDVPKLVISGHSDSTGSEAYNLKLSRSRAESVRNYLLEHGIDKESITDLQFHGYNNPLVKTPFGVAEPKNRRVEVVLQ
ncbi:MAG: OmpA family protein [Gammaproteobacteria bacterium]|nr:OmpA family protein [Gammaproteobacteria bacterium]